MRAAAVAAAALPVLVGVCKSRRTAQLLGAAALPSLHVCRFSTSMQAATPQPVPKKLDAPRVGVSAVVMRPPLHKDKVVEASEASANPQHAIHFLMVRRAKQPAKGMWSFPGGSLELGETIVQGAMRETLEETGIALRCAGGRGTLSMPEAFTAVDAISHGADGEIAFHFALVEVAAMPADPTVEGVAATDVDALQWVTLPELQRLENVTPLCDEVAQKALRLYGSGLLKDAQDSEAVQHS
eukprot:jgi/Chlat1/5618/Chrsp369S05378